MEGNIGKYSEGRKKCHSLLQMVFVGPQNSQYEVKKYLINC